MRNSELERRLLEVPHVIAIHHYDKQAPDVDLSLWKEGERKYVQKALNRLASFLQRPMIEDDFKYHPDRIDWKNELLKRGHDLLDYYQNNSLRINYISSLQQTEYYLIDSYLGTNKSKLSRLARYVSRMSLEGGYVSWTIKRKKKFVTKLKDKILELLIFLLEQKPKQL